MNKDLEKIIEKGVFKGNFKTQNHGVGYGEADLLTSLAVLILGGLWAGCVIYLL